jgi:hypothetical protein
VGALATTAAAGVGPCATEGATVLRPTATHPIYSETAGKWVKAGDLRPGDHVRTDIGTAEVTEIRPYPGQHQVFNLEVEGDHEYFAGDQRVLSHNSGTGLGCGGNSWPSKLHLPLTQFDIDSYAGLTARRVKHGGAFAGHELLQHAFLRGNGLTPKRLTGPASRQNPVMALDRPTHDIVNKAQAKIPSKYGVKSVAELHPMIVIAENAAVLRKAGVPTAVIQDFVDLTINHLKTMYPTAL